MSDICQDKNKDRYKKLDKGLIYIDIIIFFDIIILCLTAIL